MYNLKMMFVQNQQPVKPQPQAWEDVTVLAYLYTSTIANMFDHKSGTNTQFIDGGTGDWICLSCFDDIFLLRDRPASLRVVHHWIGQGLLHTDICFMCNI
jgi:hypothetical protein